MRISQVGFIVVLYSFSIFQFLQCFYFYKNAAKLGS